MSFLIQNQWNRVVRKDWPTKPRSHVRASEIGMSFVDRYMSMMGTPPSNPFSDRTLRIFDAGRVIEFIVLRALALAGILHKKQGWLELPQTEDHLKVVGRLDALIGGVVDWEEARKRVLDHLAEYKLDLDEELLEGKAMAIIDGLKAEYPKGWPEEMIVEVKSISSMAFHYSRKNQDEQGNFMGYPHNKLQLMAYLEMSGLRQGILFYVSKDDFTLREISVVKDDTELRDALYTDLRTITRYYRNREVPPKESEIVYNDRKGAFETNWTLGRSLYMTKIYGYKDADDYEARYHKQLLDINRALKHLRENKVKAEDLAVIAEYDLEQYIDKE